MRLELRVRDERPAAIPDSCATLAGVSDEEKRLVDRLSRQGEEALGRIAEELVGNPMVGRAISSALEAREKAVQAQEAAMGALNIPSAADIERLTRRLRSVSQRLEGIEDALDRLEQKAQAVAKAAEQDGSQDLSPRLDEIAEDLAKLREAVAPAAEPVPRAQERLTVNDSAA
jgi:DNA repair exonuclease SbcCD ATPase subunit